MSIAVHQPIGHDSARKHVTGAARYVDDLPEPPGTLHLYPGMSARAHAEITTLDLNAVRGAAGVVAVLTHRDIPGRNDVSPWAGDDPLFADKCVEYLGQAIFAVVAESRLQARRAARLATITYRDHPAIVTIDQAMAAGSLLEPPHVMAEGDAEAAIAAAPHKLTGRLVIGGQEHFYLEGHAVLVVPGEDGDLVVHSSSQNPTEIQHVVARVLALPYHAVTVEVRRMGGGFGGKETQCNLPAAACALAARLTGRPVKCAYDRDDDFMITGKRHDARIDYQVGFDEAGRIQGVVFDQALRCGMSYDLSQAIADRAMLHADNCYFLPQIRVTSYRCKTHTQSNTAFRGFGGPQGLLGIERVIDAIAHDLRLDPLEIRRRNFYDSADPERRRTPYGMVVEDCIIRDLTDALVVSADYSRRREEIRRFNAASRTMKRGISLTPVKFGISFTRTSMNQAGALVHIYGDGSIHLNHGGTEMGQGLFIKVAQVVAETFQVDVARVKITATTTGKVPNSSPTAASSGADLNGMAARNAAMTIRDRLAEFAAARHQRRTEEVEFRPDGVHVGGDIESFDDLVHAAIDARIALSATGHYATPAIEWDRKTARGRPFFYFAYGAAVSEVEIDVLTGENRMLRVDILHDVGRSLNPAIDLGQVEGGFIQGAGWLTTEELVWDEKGRLMTHAPSTYKIPACGDRPADMRVQLYDKGVNRAETIFRSKAVGEPPLMLASSVFLAILDAIASTADYAVAPELDAPATPERVLMAIEALRA